jgi:hypothetical protein
MLLACTLAFRVNIPHGRPPLEKYLLSRVRILDVQSFISVYLPTRRHTQSRSINHGILLSELTTLWLFYTALT